MLIKPAHLEIGDTLGIIAPASAPPDAGNIDRAAQAVEALGFKPRLAPNARKRLGFLAGSDRDRASDLMRMFADPAVKGIICVRGGYGTARLLPRLDYGLIKRNPKVFIGYSDITSLHCAFLRKARLVSFHGPMLNSDFIKPACPNFTVQSLRRTVMIPRPPASIGQGRRSHTVRTLRAGTASGPLIGGNISILCASLGTPFEPPFRNAILFFEDLDEAPYRFDRMLTQLLNGGRLQKVAGIAIGMNKHCKDPRATKSTEYRQTLEDVFKERLLPLRVPVVSGLPFGHVAANATLPIGVRATLDGDAGDLLINETAVI
ncbi:MAG TPA: LD-carboxypeptidase [Verrucomicrobiae bacterium]